MPVIRNPFRRAPPTPFNVSTESVLTESLGQSTVSLADSGKLSLEDVQPPRVASAISIPKGPDEGYKLSGGYPQFQDMHELVRSSHVRFLKQGIFANYFHCGILVVNDSGVYLPPSPPEKKSFWKKSDSSSISSKAKIPVSEEQFVIPRESFESYRRSFDISARSPISDIAPGRSSFDSRSRAGSDVRPNTRASLDVRPSRTSLDIQPSRLSLDQRPMRRGPHFFKNFEDPSEEAFEDVKLNDDARPKKRSIFARFGTDHTSPNYVPASSGIMGGRNGFFGKKDVPQETVLESELGPISNGVDKSE